MTTPTPTPTPTQTPASTSLPALAPSVQLVSDLVARVPDFRAAYDAHVFSQGRVLPHVFFWDVVQDTVRSFLGEEGRAVDWRRTLDFLEEQSGRGVVGVDEVIVTSFLGDLPHPHEPGYGIVAQLGPVLAARFGRIRPGG
ncbi:hypothetical protein ACIGO8_03285 [Streptomyces sp. NPDC053493]|uniref:hypothetical protein n=1 Tax=Streptomyces sp. NPDC053493 TaxID=3365705 RepID=UPI0037D15A69